MKRLIPLLAMTCAAVAFAAGTWYAVAGGREQIEDAVGLGVGYRLPSFSCVDLKGQKHTLKSYEGSILVLHFWASWCPYCRGEIEELVKLQDREWTSQGVRVLTVNTDQEPAKLREFLAKTPLPYPVIVDVEAKQSIAAQYGVSGIPVTYVVTRDGHIAARLEGSSEIIQAVQRALSGSGQV